jgi:hypothetical protein
MHILVTLFGSIVMFQAKWHFQFSNHMLKNYKWARSNPKFLRSNYRTEIILFANAQLMLVQQQDLIAGIKLQDCYLFNMFTVNQCIESWWRQLSKR